MMWPASFYSGPASDYIVRLLAEGNDVLCADNFIVQALGSDPITFYGERAHSVTVEDIIPGGYTATKTPPSEVGP